MKKYFLDWQRHRQPDWVLNNRQPLTPNDQSCVGFDMVYWERSFQKYGKRNFEALVTKLGGEGGSPSGLN
jgi:hypothetical protein